MDSRPIGIFDSGIGGLTAVQEFRQILPHENIVYFGDTARLPYGTRSRDTILKYAMQDIKFLLSKDVKMIVAACGTVSSMLPAALPEFDFLYGSVLLPAVQAACTATKTGRIGVIGTSATIRSGSYGKAIRTIRSDIVVVGNACPLLVPLVENGFTDKGNEITKLALKQYLAPFADGAVDTLILGCTHYPILHEHIAEILGDEVTLISPGAEAARNAEAELTSHEMLREGSQGSCTYYVSDSEELFCENARAFLGNEFSGNATRVDVDTL